MVIGVMVVAVLFRCLPIYAGNMLRCLAGAFLRSRRQWFLRLGVGVLPKGGPGVAFRWFGPCSVNVRGLS